MSDEAGESRKTCSAPRLALSTVDSDSSDESDEEDDADPALLKAIEDEVKSRRAIEKIER